ncbi:NUDIX domain-containing protein [Corynebacterium flavescens]|uniref:NUDIX domain-containing protein n=1 Tax=Corynebacterium flavescens TaxID=28028 RepID=UPI000EC5B05B|nr:NTP pyrophosphohydrolase [Corynebacterium flavescens]
MTSQSPESAHASRLSSRYSSAAGSEAASLKAQGSGDGWAAGPDGIKVWGKFGAAGLFLVAGDEVLLQFRAKWTNAGHTWGIPGGARDFEEPAVAAALRETHEECAIEARDVTVLGEEVTAGPYPAAAQLPGQWTYTTVLAQTLHGERLATVANAESEELRWVALDEVEKLPLLGAFRKAFPYLRQRFAHLKQ